MCQQARLVERTCVNALISQRLGSLCSGGWKNVVELSLYKWGCWRQTITPNIQFQADVWSRGKLMRRCSSMVRLYIGARQAELLFSAGENQLQTLTWVHEKSEKQNFRKPLPAWHRLETEFVGVLSLIYIWSLLSIPPHLCSFYTTTSSVQP